MPASGRAWHPHPHPAALLGIARGVAYESVRNGSIPATRTGRRWLVPRKRFHAWLDAPSSWPDRGRWATWLVDDGVPPNMVQRVMAHERSATTLDLYTRRTEDPTRILRALNDAPLATT